MREDRPIQHREDGRMKLAMVISQTNPELVFNALRLANFTGRRGTR